MKFLLLLVVAGVVRALPQSKGSAGSVSPKTGQQTGLASLLGIFDPAGKSTSNDVTDGPCRDIFLIIARGSIEPGNIGISTGQMLCDLLKKNYGNKIGCQGVDPKGYSANLADNGRPKGTADASIEAGVKEFDNAYNKCPKSRFVFTGFSQGAAVMHNAIPLLSEPVRRQIVAGVLIGDTRNKASNGTIKSFPTQDLLIICAENDGVCKGGAPTAGHIVYTFNGDIDKGANFLISKIDTALKSH